MQPPAVRISGSSDRSLDGVYYRGRKWSGSPWRWALQASSVPVYGLGCLVIGLSADLIFTHLPLMLPLYAIGGGAFVGIGGVLVARNLLR